MRDELAAGMDGPWNRSLPQNHRGRKSTEVSRGNGITTVELSCVCYALRLFAQSQRFTTRDQERKLSSCKGLVIAPRYIRCAVTETGTPLVSESKTGECPGPSWPSSCNFSSGTSALILKLTRIPWYPLRTFLSSLRNPCRSRSPSKEDSTSSI